MQFLKFRRTGSRLPVDPKQRANLPTKHTTIYERTDRYEPGIYHHIHKPEVCYQKQMPVSNFYFSFATVIDTTTLIPR